VFRLFYPLTVVLAFSVIVLLNNACRSQQASSTTASKTDSAGSSRPNNDIHTSGKVKTGTFVNGPAQDTSSTGTKPKQ
jgi:hypothetical protein